MADNRKKESLVESSVCAAEDCGVAQLKIAKYKFTWKLNTSTIHKEVGESTTSPVFTMSFCPDIRWHIELHPKSICRKGFSTLYLCLESGSNVEMQALYKFSILNNKNEEDLKSYDWCIFSGTNINRTPHYFNTDRLINKNTGKLLSEEFTIICKIWLTLNNLEDNDGEDFARLLEDKTFSDLTFVVGGKELNAHKNVLALKSPVFLSLFNEEVKNKKESLVEIKDIEYDVMKELLRYVYTRKVENLTEHAKALLAAAEKYGLHGLKNMCEKDLCKNLSLDNVASHLILSELHKASTLKREAINFVIHNLKSFDLPAFGLLVESQPKLLAEILHTMGKKDSDANVDKSFSDSNVEDKLLTFFF